MTVRELKTNLHKIIAAYFAGATVLWADQKAVKSLPCVTLKLRALSRTTFPISRSEDGAPVSSYPSRAMLEVQLFTRGRPAGQGPRAAMENTALHDMEDFLDYMASPHAEDEMDRLDITILPEGPVQDISALLDANVYEYRAMQEFTVDYTRSARGAAGIAPGPAAPDEPAPPWKPTDSGGGTEDLADKAVGWFEEVETPEEQEE